MDFSGALTTEQFELTTLLVNTQSPVLNIRTEAEAKLVEAQENNFERFLIALTNELKTQGRPEVSRQLAGLMLKNAISGKDPRLDGPLREKWLHLPQESVSNPIKECLVATLQSPCDVAASAACLVISKIARLEIPAELWPQLIPCLKMLAAPGSDTTSPQQANPPKVRQTALTCLGYICEDIQALSDELCKDLIEESVKRDMLAIISQNLQDNNEVVLLAATKALYHALVFAARRIEVDEEREGLFALVTRVLQHPNEDIQRAAWDCALQLANEYYEYLGAYMEKLGPLSWETIQRGSKTAVHAIELWNSFCDEEILIQQGESNRTSKRFVAQATQYLLPILFEATTKQESEETDPGDWTLAMAAGTCVGLCAQVIRDDILQPALIFIDSNFVSPDWKRREAAMLVYGSIMEGPSDAKLAELVIKSFESVCKSLSDQSIAVRDTTAWAMGKVAAFHLECICNFLGSVDQAGLLHLLTERLSDEPRVAANVCYALYEIFQNIREVTNAGEANNDVSSCPTLDSHFPQLADALLTVAKRPDAAEHQLRSAAFNTLYMLIKEVSGPECTHVMASVLLRQVLEWLTLALSSTNPASEEMSAIEESVCGCLNGIMLRLGSGPIQPYADQIFNLLCRVIAVQNGNVPIQPDSSQSPASEEAMLALGAFVVAVGTNFKNHMTEFMAILLPGLRNYGDQSFCSMCIDIVGDLARSLGDGIAPYATQLMEEVFVTLKHPAFPNALKPKVVAAIGDVAAGSEKSFEPLLVSFLEFLDLASTAKATEESEDWVAYIQELRDATLSAYTSIICGRGSVGDLSPLKCRVVIITNFVELVATDPISSDSNLKNAVQVVCDLIDLYRGDYAKYLMDTPCLALLKNRAVAIQNHEAQQQLCVLDQLMTKYATS